MKQTLLSAPYEVCLERAKYFTEVYKETEDEHPAIRNALALKRTLEKQPIFIYEDEWIAGSKTGKFLSGVLSVERGDFLRVLQMEIDILEHKYRPFRMSEEDKRYFKKVILPYWDGRSVRDLKGKAWVKNGITESIGFVHFFKQARNFVKFAKYVGGKENLRKMGGVREQHPKSSKRLIMALMLRDELSKNNPNMALYCYDVQGHLTIGCDNVVKYGYRGLIDRAKEKMASLKKDDPEYYNKSKFLEAVIISLDAAIHYARRFSELAKQMAEKELNPERKERLIRISENLKWAPEHPARTFYEGIQAAHFALLVGEIQYGMHDVLGVGRADQYLYPLYKNDIEEGRLTREEAIELIQEWNLKLTANVSLVPEAGAEANGALGVSQHCVIIGGVDRDGKDATNELSYLMLDAYEDMNGAINQLSVMVHKNSPKEFLEKAAKVFRRASGISFFNDDLIVSALVNDGCQIEDARDNTIVGCIETSPPDTFPCPGGHEIVLPAILYYTLTNGEYPGLLPGQKRPIKTGDAMKFETFDEFMGAFKKQLSYNIKLLVDAIAAKDEVYIKNMPSPYVSALMGGCIENAKDMTCGGAKHDFTSIIAHGIATTTDSIYTIKKMVFEDKEMTMKELIDACLGNFPDETLRQKILTRLPKYGSGNEEVNEIARQITKMFYDEVVQYRNIRGGRFRVGMYSYGNHVLDGFFLGATPDGRKRGEPVSNGISPSNRLGEKNEATTVCASVASIGQNLLSGGVSFNIKLHPSNIKSDEGAGKFASLISTYFQLGGMHVQPNVVSNEMLRDAQKNPDEYRDLIVKVAGYSAYFTDLGKSIQEDIIAREEF